MDPHDHMMHGGPLLWVVLAASAILLTVFCLIGRGERQERRAVLLALSTALMMIGLLASLIQVASVEHRVAVAPVDPAWDQLLRADGRCRGLVLVAAGFLGTCVLLAVLGGQSLVSPKQRFDE